VLTASPQRATIVRQQRRRSLITRQRILAASLHLFSTRGFARTTVRDIAREAGITDAAIYYHFATKHELLGEVINAQLPPGHWVAHLDSNTRIRDKLQEAVNEIARAIDENDEQLIIILREGLAGDPDAACRYGQLLDAWESRLAGRLLPFETTGGLAPGDARPVARQILYSIIMAFEDMLLLRPDPSLPPAQRRLQTLVFISRTIDRLLAPKCPPAEVENPAEVS